jgi:DNA-binding XRE family transcriptional regulator
MEAIEFPNRMRTCQDVIPPPRLNSIRALVPSLLRSFYKCKRLRTGSVPFVPRAQYDTPPPELVRLGAALKALREERGLKQIEVASGADMTESQVSDIERGKNSPGWLLLIRLIVDGLDADLRDLAAAYERVAEKETA